MSGNEFDEIAELFRPLTQAAPEALGLMDDAAVIPSRPGYDLVVTKDAIIAGVHALADDPPADLARKLLRVNLSDLAAKGAIADGAFLAVSWPKSWDISERREFAQGLGEDCKAFGVRLFGGDTVRTPGPFQASLTLLGWVPAGRMVRRGGAHPGDMLLVTGSIGDGFLGLSAAQGAGDFGDADRIWLADRYRRPQPRTNVSEVLRQFATAAADVSDGLIADAGHVGEASGVKLSLDLDRIPLSPAASRWLDQQADKSAARVVLATGGDDYEIVCTAPPQNVTPLQEQFRVLGISLSVIGRVEAGEGTIVISKGRELVVSQRGWSHIQ